MVTLLSYKGLTKSLAALTIFYFVEYYRQDPAGIWALTRGSWTARVAFDAAFPLPLIIGIGHYRVGEKIIKEVPMAAGKKPVTESKKKRAAEVAEAVKQAPEPEVEEVEAYEPASAKDIPRPATTLSSPPRTKIGKLTISLLGDLASAPSLEDVARLNQAPASQGRTPLITVIQAVLAKAGGTLNLEDLTAQSLKHWNRPLPATPYTPEQFIYVMARSSDNIKVSE